MATPNRFLKMVFFVLNKKTSLALLSGKRIIAKNAGSTKPPYYPMVEFSTHHSSNEKLVTRLNIYIFSFKKEKIKYIF